MIKGNHVVRVEHKKYSEFKRGEMVCVKVVDRKKGLYKIDGKGQYKAKLLMGILSPVKKEDKGD